MVDYKRRKLVNKLGLIWTVPAINSVILPSHAQSSDIPITSLGFDMSNLTCGESLPLTIGFTLSNTTSSAITINNLVSSGFNHLNPALPITIAAFESQRFSVSSADYDGDCSPVFDLPISYNITV